jgi:DNA-binding beta-propeller fold protein YncE
MMRTGTALERLFYSALLIVFSCLVAFVPGMAVAADKAPMGKIAPDRARLWSPGKIAVDTEGTLYVVDAYKNRVQTFDSKGAFLGSIRILRPAAIAASPDGNVYIGSYKGYSVAVYKNGELTGHLGAGDHEFSSIGGIAVDKTTGDVYVADTRANTIKIYLSTGSLKGKIGGFTAPSAVTVTDKAVIVLDAPAVPCPATITVQGKEVACTDCTNCSGTRLSLLDKTGVPVNAVLETDAKTGIMSRPVALASDALGNIYIADSLSMTVLAYNQKLDFLGEFASAEHDLHAPVAVAVSADNSLYVSSSETRSIVEIGLAGTLHTAQAGTINFQTKAGVGASLGVLGY